MENEPLSPRSRKREKRASLLDAFPNLDIQYRDPLSSSSGNAMKSFKARLEGSMRGGWPPSIKSMRGDRPSAAE